MHNPHYISFDIGKFTIVNDNGKFWIYINDEDPSRDGEGMGTSEEKLEKCISEFYGKEF